MDMKKLIFKLQDAIVPLREQLFGNIQEKNSFSENAIM
jgi:hypothetical protein